MTLENQQTSESGSEAQPRIALEMRRITKRFPGVLANDSISFELKSGEVHAILGENGAGKTTLMNILYGLYAPDEGEICLNGKPVKLGSPKDAIDHGIGMVHQHFMLIPSLTVTQNVVLGLRSPKGIVLDRDYAEKRINQLSKEYGLKVDPKAKIWQLSVGERQRVEIIKALYRNARILILDEPTAVLTPPEVKEIVAIIRRMADQGLAVIPFITHKLPEVMAISDKVTVLRQGKVVSTVDSKQTNEKELARMMVGKDVLFRVERHTCEIGGPVLEVKNLSVLNDKGLPALKKVSFSICKGEILGIAGVSGNGQRELEETLMGLRKGQEGGIRIRDRDMLNRSTREIMDQGSAFIPEDRIGRGLAVNLSVAENLILNSYSDPDYSFNWFLPFKNRWFLNEKEINTHVSNLIKEYDIKTPSKDVPTKNLSGGNLQKLILARELSRSPALLVAAQPTRGLDVGATEFIRNKLMEQKTKGVAILLISEDLDEIMSMSDHVAVMYEGEIVGNLPIDEVKIEDIGLMMAGASRMPKMED